MRDTRGLWTENRDGVESEADREAILTRRDPIPAALTRQEETESTPERRKVVAAEGADPRTPTGVEEDLTPKIRGRVQAPTPENPNSLGLQEERSTAMTRKG